MRVLLLMVDEGEVTHITSQLSGVTRPTFYLRVARSLADCLSISREHPAEAILMDPSLPDEYGLDAIVKVIQGAPNSAVVVITSEAEDGLAMAAIRAGAQDFVHRDEIDTPALVHALVCAIERFRLRRATQATRADGEFGTRIT